MKEIVILVLLALLFISGEARPKDEVGIEPVSPLPTFAASNGTEIKTTKPSRLIPEGSGKRSVPDESDQEEAPESEVQVGPIGGDVVVRQEKVENQEEIKEDEENARNEDRQNEGEEATESAGETKTKISFSRDRRSPQDQDSTSEVDNDKSSEEDNTTVVIAVARPQRPGLFVASEVGDAEKEENPEVAHKESTDVATDFEADTASSRSRRNPQSKDDNNDKSSEEDTSEDSTTAAIPVVRPSRPVFHRLPTEGTPRKEETSCTEGNDKSEKESVDETSDSTEDTSTSRSKRHPQTRDDSDEDDKDKSSEEDTQDESPAVASSEIGSLRPLLRRPTEVNIEEATPGNDKQDKESDEDTSEETHDETIFSRKKRSPQTNEGNDKNSKDTKSETTAAPTITRTQRPTPQRAAVGGGATGKPAAHPRATPSPPRRIPTPTPVTRRPTPSHTTKSPSS